MAREKSHCGCLEDLVNKLNELDLCLPFVEDTGILAAPLKVGRITMPNRLGIAPMEGVDSMLDGSPSDHTIRRYTNEAIGGSAVIWFEAISIVQEGRPSKTQLLPSRDNLENHKALTEKVEEAGRKKNGYTSYLIMQANHSGRYSNPDNRPAPMTAYRHPYPKQYRAADDPCIVTDDYLKGLEEAFSEATGLVKEAGFDAVGIKCCHGYLPAELSSAYTRPGNYGSNYENCTRLPKHSIQAAKIYKDNTLQVTSRLGIYGGYTYPYGFGVSQTSGLSPDLTEPIRLVKELYEDYGLAMIDLTMGNPYATTHVTRPHDMGKCVPDEHPLIGIARIIQGIGTVKNAIPGIVVYGSAPTYLRQYADLFTTGAVKEGFCDGMLFGRIAFAGPDFANEIIRYGRINPKRVCMTCGKCGDLIRTHKPTGCVIRDPDISMSFYRDFQENKKYQPADFRG